MKSISVQQCNRCQHVWLPAKLHVPKWCPLCKSPYWNKPRVRQPRVKPAQ